MLTPFNVPANVAGTLASRSDNEWCDVASNNPFTVNESAEDEDEEVFWRVRVATAPLPVGGGMAALRSKSK